MSKAIEPPFTTAKVIAAGAMKDGSLRATIMFAPGAADLAHWPSRMIKWLGSSANTGANLERRPFRLSILAMPVRYSTAGSGCLTLPQSNIPTIEAEASAMESIWKPDTDVGWVDELWAEAFSSRQIPQTWQDLARIIAAASSTTGGAFKGGEKGMAGSGDENDGVPADDLSTKPVPGNNKTATLDWILPSRQTELSILLEYKRALELCDSVGYALERRSAVLSKEIECSLIAQTRARDQSQDARRLELKELLKATSEQYKAALASAGKLYAEEPCGPERAVAHATGHPRALGGAERPALEEMLHNPLDRYQAANRPQRDPRAKDDFDSRVEALSQVFYALQASPTLSRLFGLTVDVRMRGDTLRQIVGAQPALADGGHFLYLAFDGVSSGHDDSVYTFAKYRPSSLSPHFWPASRVEVALGPAPDVERVFDLAQYEGVIVAGRRLDTGVGFVNRFEVSSLDVRSACEAALDRRQVDLTKKELEAQCESSSPATRPTAIARKTYSTAGLVVLDRGRQQQAVSQFASRIAIQKRNSGMPIVLDAEDLTIGYRIDVGVPLIGEKTANYAWRSLMARNMKYGINGLHAEHVRAIAQRLFLEESTQQTLDPDLSWRQCLEDGLLALPARLISKNNSSDSGPVDAYVEEAIGCWTGEPMSVSCAGKRTEKVKPLYGLPSGCVVSAPTSKKDPHRRTPALRFGNSYRLGLRAVYPGGISVPLEVAAQLYDMGRKDLALGGSLTIPAIPAFSRKASGEQVTAEITSVRRRDQLRRFLRHERIDAPFLLMPEQVALRRNGLMGYERAAHAVIRTVHPNAQDRENPILTQRVFVAPGVGQSFAAMHGVFDKSTAQHPAQGLSSSRFGPHGVRFDAQEKGGFPIVTSDYISGFNGVQYPSSRRISTHTHGQDADSGDLVYSTSKPSGSRETPYYPDPAVDAYAVGVRIAGSSTYLDGGPCVISAYGNGYAYPECRPLVVTVQRAPAKQHRSAYPRLEEILSWPKTGSTGRLSGHGPSAIHLPGGVEALLSLAPGDDFEVDVWCIPNAKDLARIFAVIESIGSLAMARATIENRQGVTSSPTREQLCTVLKSLLPALVCETADKCLPVTGNPSDAIADWAEGCGGPGGLPAPGPESLHAIGQALFKALVKRPLDEIAAVRTLRATHATDQPMRVPEFALPLGFDHKVVTTGGPILNFFRVNLSQDEPNRFSATGDLLIQLPTTGCLEISSCMVSPSSVQFDDLRRSRALRDRRLDTWPKLDNGSPVPARHIFGFDVSGSGDVSLLQTEVVLYRLDNIPLPKPEEPEKMSGWQPSPSMDGVYRTSLEQVLNLRGRDEFLGTGKPAYQFTDGLARLLRLRITAYARHSDQMRSASKPAHNGRWLRDGEPLSVEASSVQSSYVETWLPAAVRPTEPAALTPIPTFLWISHPEDKRPGQHTWRVKRRTLIRIPLGRPWFSSGEDERLGIVVWPPGLFAQKPEDLANDRAEAAPEHFAVHGRLMNLIDFQDEDLGPGGKFITRWGGDPIRIPVPFVPSPRTFVPAAAFLDAMEDMGTGFRAELVTNVTMPVRTTGNGVRNSPEKGSVPQTLRVSLLTYKPKFDVYKEQWYVDVAMEHEGEAEPFVRLGLVRFQPHAPAHLQLSYPVAQWTQLLPSREVQVRKSKAAVSIRVEGLATSPPSDNICPECERPAVPKMIARVTRECNLELGVPTRRVVKESILGVSLQTGADAYRAIWEEELPLNLNKNEDARERPEYFVVIEEQEARLPASYANEPVSPAMAMGRKCSGEFCEEVLVESGPRFLARISLQ